MLRLFCVTMHALEKQSEMVRRNGQFQLVDSFTAHSAGAPVLVTVPDDVEGATREAAIKALVLEQVGPLAAQLYPKGRFVSHGVTWSEVDPELVRTAAGELLAADDQLNRAEQEARERRKAKQAEKAARKAARDPRHREEQDWEIDWPDNRPVLPAPPGVRDPGE